jgi:hypothetical protein
MPQPVPAIPQIPAGWRPDQADMDLWVTDSFSFLTRPAVFRAQLAGTQALTGGSFNLIHLDTVLEDPYSGWSATATSSQPAFSWLCPAGAGGWYEASLAAFTANQATTSALVAVALFLNGAIWAQGSGDWAVSGGTAGSNGTVAVPLTPGDFVQAAAFASISVSTPSGGPDLSFELAWVSS